MWIEKLERKKTRRKCVCDLKNDILLNYASLL